MKHDLSPADLGVRYFSIAELRGWWYDVDPRWLVCADLLREYSGLILEISPVKGAIGRHSGKDNMSDHNVDKWKRVYGIDVMPRFFQRRKKGSMEEQAYEFFQHAQWCGFTAIGYYPDWCNAKGNPSPGFHLGTRRDRRPTNPATWGGLRKVKGKSKYQYVSLIEALKETEKRIA